MAEPQQPQDGDETGAEPEPVDGVEQDAHRSPVDREPPGDDNYVPV